MHNDTVVRHGLVFVVLHSVWSHHAKDVLSKDLFTGRRCIAAVKHVICGKNLSKGEGPIIKSE